MILEHCRVFSNRLTVTAKSYPLGLPSITEIIRTNLLKYDIVPRYKQSLMLRTIKPTYSMTVYYYCLRAWCSRIVIKNEPNPPLLS